MHRAQCTVRLHVDDIEHCVTVTLQLVITGDSTQLNVVINRAATRIYTHTERLCVR